MKNKIYFLSDFHLGVPDAKKSLDREKRICRLLDEIKKDASEIYLLGDLFDFWFEYKTVVPRGYVRILGKISELSDEGIPIHLFTGNHDMWIFDYLPGELGLTLHRNPIKKTFSGKHFFIGHGDGLGPGDHGYKMLKKIFSNPVCKTLFRWIHPDIGIRIAQFWSGKSRTHTLEETYLGDDKEFLVRFSKEMLRTEKIDFFIFGHRHLALSIDLGQGSKYFNLGEWFNAPHYAVFDGVDLTLERVV